MGNVRDLIHNDDGTTSCQLILENKIKDKDSGIVFEQGCVFQKDYPALYNFFYSKIILKKAMENYFKALLFRSIDFDILIFIKFCSTYK